MLGFAPGLLPPRLEEPPIAHRGAILRGHVEQSGHTLNPFRSALKLRIKANRRLIHHAVSSAVRPLRAPLLIPKHRHKPDRLEYLYQGFAVRDFRLRLHAMLVRILTNPRVGHALMRQHPAPVILSNPHQLTLLPQPPVRRVIQHIRLKAAWCFQMKADRGQPLFKLRLIRYTKLDLRLNRLHGPQCKAPHHSTRSARFRSAFLDNEKMQTLRLRVRPEHLDSPESIAVLERAAEILRNGGTVALPTETVYGLGANALDPDAVAKIFAAKQRPSWDPLIVHVAGPEMLDAITLPRSQAAQSLIDAFWPGPLTLLLPRTSAVPDAVTAGRPLVGIRMPAHPVARELIRRAGVPIAAPSANRFGHISPTTADHVLADLDGRIDAVIDAGPAHVGLESTVLDTTASPMLVYRPGAITLAQIRAVAGPAELYQETEMRQPREGLPSPGVGLRHYAPHARLVLIEIGGCMQQWTAQCARNLLTEANSYTGQRVGILLPDSTGSIEVPSGIEIYSWGSWQQLETLAQRLFAGLRALDAAGCTVILCPLPPDIGVGVALRDRLSKAAVKADAE